MNVIRNKNGWYDVIDVAGKVISADFTEEIDAWIWIQETESIQDNLLRLYG